METIDTLIREELRDFGPEITEEILALPYTGDIDAYRQAVTAVLRTRAATLRRIRGGAAAQTPSLDLAPARIAKGSTHRK